MVFSEIPRFGFVHASEMTNDVDVSRNRNSEVLVLNFLTQINM
jgi:hypothetical protein